MIIKHQKILQPECKAFVILLIFLTCIFKHSAAKTYYFSSSQGDDSRSILQAQNASAPWKTLDKLNSFFNNLKPGDSVLFKKGDVFYGSVTVSQSGTLNHSIVLSAYGTGVNPKITGLTTLSSWAYNGNGVYYTSLDVPALNMVTLDGVVKGMGRYPNKGYLNYESHNGNTSITDNQLSGTPNWTGAEVVIRKYRWILDRHTIINQSGGKLTYNALSTYGNNNAYSPVDGNGYFIQNHLGTLDQLGEWYYDKANKRLYMYFDGTIPSLHIIKVSTIDKNIAVSVKSYVTFSNIDFEGGNTQGAYLVATKHFNFNNCNFFQQGGNALYGINVSYITINGGAIKDALNNGVWMEYGDTNSTVNAMQISNIGTIAGATVSGDGGGIGIAIKGDNTTISNNAVTNTGYNGIDFTGNNILVEKNVIDTFCLVKDDGGGIYTYDGDTNGQYTNRIIRSNIILNPIGAFTGAEAYYYEPFGKAAGIYLDGYAQNIEVVENTIANGEWGGIYLNGSSNIKINNNTVYNFNQQIDMLQFKAGQMRHIIWEGNKFISKMSVQTTLCLELSQNDDISLIGTGDHNYYARPLNDNKTITINRNYTGGGGSANVTVKQWQAASSEDLHSKKSPITITDTSLFRFEYNPTSEKKIIPLDAVYIGVDSIIYSNSITLAPYSSLVLFKLPLILPLGFLSFEGEKAGKNIQLQWKIANENTDFFEVLKSNDCVHFQSIGQLLSNTKSQNSSYIFIDNKPFSDKNYYQIKQVDKDGKCIYSKIVGVSFVEAVNFDIMPNPALNKIIVSTNTSLHFNNAMLFIRTTTGSIIKNMPISFSNKDIPIDISKLTNGVYFISIVYGNTVINKQFIKQK